MRLAGRLTSVSSLTSEDRRAMLELMNRHYLAVDAELFHADLAEKNWIIELRERDTGRLCGFSTQALLEVNVAGRPIRALFSGDTIVDRKHWGDPALSHVWGRLALELIDAATDVELYWFLLSQGRRTYRFLPLFFREFYPRCDAPTPAGIAQKLDVLAQRKFPTDYDSRTGVVRASARQYRLRPELDELPAGRGGDPHVRFFYERNPGHAGGDELCCLAPLTRENFTPAAYRVIGPEPAAAGVGESG
jgi:hypothetical protein